MLMTTVVRVYHECPNCKKLTALIFDSNDSYEARVIVPALWKADNPSHDLRLTVDLYLMFY